MPHATLPSRSLLEIGGEDALPFLQGLVTNDVLALADKKIIYTALLTPQGKYLHDFFVIKKGESVLLEGDASRMTELLQRLMKYRLRSKVTLKALPENMGVSVVWGQPDVTVSADSNLLVLPDPRVEALGFRIIGELADRQRWQHEHDFASATADDYDTHRIMQGVPEGGSDLVPEKSFLLPFGFEDLHGVDFKKGCYVGQEVTARSKHLGQVRKRIYKLRAAEGNLPETGSPVTYEASTAGELRSVRGSTGLALMSVEAIEKAKQLQIDFRCGEQIVYLELPYWIKSI